MHLAAGPAWRCESISPSPPQSRASEYGQRIEERDSDRGRSLCCVACGAVITHEHARIEIGDTHTHTFVNPHGLVFQIGCFERAPGCVGVGPAEAFFSWFPGYAWRVSVCQGCSAHLGWSYGERPDFYGLVLDRLRNDDAEGSAPTPNR